MRIMIVDDEYFILEGMTSLIQAEFGFAETYAYRSAVEALRCMDSIRPDIIISDIHMDDLNGIEFIRLVRANYQTVKVIIISGYDNFEYARSAIALNVQKYILKPVSQENLIKVLGETIDDIHQLEQETETMDFSLKTAKQRIVTDIFLSGVLDEPVLAQMKLTGLDTLLSEYYVCSLLVCEYMMAVPYESADFMVNLRRHIGACVLAEMKENGVLQYLFVDTLRGNLILIAQCHISICQKVMQNVCRELMDTLSLHADFRISNQYRDWRELFVAYCESQGISLAEIPVSGCNTDLDVLLQINEMKRQMLASIAKDTPTQIGEKLYMIADILSSRYNRNDLAVKFCMELMHTTFRKVIDDERQAKYRARLNTNKYEQVESISALMPEIKEIKSLLSDYHAVMLHERAVSLVEQVKAEIHDHFAEITQEIVAAEAGVSATYLSLLFKEITGENFKDYLIAVKINFAKDRLYHSDAKISEIALAAGYSDIKYFSRNFRRIVGCSPSEFREHAAALGEAART